MSIERTDGVYEQERVLEELLNRWQEGDPIGRIQRARRGDETAITEVVTLMHPYALAVAEKLIPGSPEVEDLAQNAMLKVCLHLNRFRNDNADSFPKWVKKVVTRDVRRMEAKMARQIPTNPYHLENNDQLVRESFEDDSIKRVDLPQLRKALSSGLNVLTRQQRTIITGVAEEGINGIYGDDRLLYKQLARREQIPIGSIGPTVMRVRAKLRPQLSQFTYYIRG